MPLLLSMRKRVRAWSCICFSRKRKLLVLGMEVIILKQEGDNSLAKPEELKPEAQCVFGLAEKVKKIDERVSAFKIVAHLRVTEGGKSPTTSLSERKLTSRLRLNKTAWSLMTEIPVWRS